MAILSTLDSMLFLMKPSDALQIMVHFNITAKIYAQPIPLSLNSNIFVKSYCTEVYDDDFVNDIRKGNWWS